MQLPSMHKNHFLVMEYKGLTPQIPKTKFRQNAVFDMLIIYFYMIHFNTTIPPSSKIASFSASPSKFWVNFLLLNTAV